jgi:hypothetical protein
MISFALAAVLALSTGGTHAIGLQAEAGIMIAERISVAPPFFVSAGVEWRLSREWFVGAQLGLINGTLQRDIVLRGESGWRKQWDNGVTFETKLSVGLRQQFVTAPLFAPGASVAQKTADFGLPACAIRLWLGPGYDFGTLTSVPLSVMLGIFVQATVPRFDGVSLEPGAGFRFMWW